MRNKFYAVLLLVLALGMVLTACGKDTVEVTKIVEKEKIVEVTAVPEAKRPVIKVGQNVGNSPWVFNQGGEIVGFETEMVREALDRMGYDMEVVDVPFAGIFAGLQADKWQIAASSIFIKKERVEQMDFSDPWFDDYESFVVPVGSDIHSLDDLEGKTIGTEAGTSHDAYLNSLLEEYGPFEIKGYDRRPEWVLDLQAGRIDAGVGDFASDAYYIADKPDLEQRLKGGTEWKQGCAFKQGDPLRDEFNVALNEMKKDGTLLELYKKWFGGDPPEGSSITKIYTEPYVPEQ